MNLSIIVDESIGRGHWMRCHAIAEEWKERGREVIWQKLDTSAKVVLVDGYSWTPKNIARFQAAGKQVVRIDDLGGGPSANGLINYNYGAGFDHYQLSNGVLALFGPQNAPIRKEIVEQRNNVPDFRHISANDIFDCDAVNRSLDPDQFTQRLLRAKIIICSAGVTVYEALCLGRPVFLRCSSDNQVMTYNGLIANGYAIPATESLCVGEDTLHSLSAKGQELIDGQGAVRISNFLERFYR